MRATTGSCAGSPRGPGAGESRCPEQDARVVATLDACVLSSLGGAVVHILEKVRENPGHVPAVSSTTLLRLLVTEWLV